MNCQLCGEKGQEMKLCELHRKPVCICCGMCVMTTNSLFTTCVHGRLPTQKEPRE